MSICCTADPDTFKPAMGAIVHSLELELYSVRAGQKPVVGSELKNLVLSRTVALFSPVPRLEEPVVSAPPRTAAPATPDRVIALPQKPRSPVAEQSAPTNPPEARKPRIRWGLSDELVACIRCSGMSPNEVIATRRGRKLSDKLVACIQCSIAEAPATSPENYTTIHDSADAPPLAA
jgi:hypothetical protein